MVARHIAIHSGRTDVAQQIAHAKARRDSNTTKVAVLSARGTIESWEPSVWLQGSNTAHLCERFNKHRASVSGNTHWIVVVDMMDTVPICREYNNLFKDKNITVVAVSNHASVLREHRFGTRFTLNNTPPAAPAARPWWWWITF
jgi:hypothetical protein